MGHQIIKQPNGLLAIYSNGVDAWVMWNMTPKQVVHYYAKRAAQSARESAQDAVNHVMADEPNKVYCQFTMTFAEANARSKAGQGGDDGPEGPVDEKLLEELRHFYDEPEDTMDNHLIFGAGQDDAR
jgi:hypothetical protein